MTELSSSDKELLTIYNEIDAFLRRNYRQDKYSDHIFLIQELSRSNRIINRHQAELRAVAQIRNSLVHNPFTGAEPIVEIHPEVIKRYRAIRNALLNPDTALSIAVPTAKIFNVSLNSNLSKVLESMEKNIYTHVPVIKDDKMIGILSENTILAYLVESGEGIITKDMLVNDIAHLLPLEAHKSEKFIFLPRNASLGQVYGVFNKAIHKHERIGMVFITEHGKSEEKLLGIITAWDLASPEFDL